MNELIELIQKMRGIAENSSPVINDLCDEALEYINTHTFYSKEEVHIMLDRRDDVK